MRLVRFFIYSSAVILLLTAIAKLLGSAGHAKILAQLDPVVGIPARNLILIAGLVELVVAVTCLFDKGLWMSTGLIGWLSTNLLAYRVWLNIIHYTKPCECLGNLTDVLHISPQTADTITKITLAYLLIGSYTTLFWLWRRQRKTVLVAPFADKAIDSTS